MLFVTVEVRTSMYDYTVKEHSNLETTDQLWNEFTTEMNSASKKNGCEIVVFEKRWYT
jgi:hypothetical protein